MKTIKALKSELSDIIYRVRKVYPDGLLYSEYHYGNSGWLSVNVQVSTIEDEISYYEVFVECKDKSTPLKKAKEAGFSFVVEIKDKEPAYFVNAIDAVQHALNEFSQVSVDGESIPAFVILPKWDCV